MEKTATSQGTFDPIKDKAWYVISSYSGYEFKVADDLKAKLTNDFAEYFDEVLIITTEEKKTVVTPAGKERIKTKILNLFPGYIYVRLVMTDEVWYAIRNTKYVSGIVGSHGGGVKPTPVRDDDMNRLLRLAKRDDLVVNTEIDYFVGDRVAIQSGPMSGYIGSVVAFEKTKNVVRLSVEKFENVSVVVETVNVKKIGKLDETAYG